MHIDLYFPYQTSLFESVIVIQIALMANNSLNKIQRFNWKLWEAWFEKKLLNSEWLLQYNNWPYRQY